MPRPKCCRRINRMPGCRRFQPECAPDGEVREIELSLDELEALRLADLEGLYQENAAGRMQVSRQTFGRIVESARRKVATALVEGRSLRIEGGSIEMQDQRAFTCIDCNHVWTVAHGTGRPAVCPACGSVNLHRASADRGGPSCGGHRRRHGCRAVRNSADKTQSLTRE